MLAYPYVSIKSNAKLSTKEIQTNNIFQCHNDDNKQNKQTNKQKFQDEIYLLFYPVVI